ncbi:MAG: enolase C-terminal domain-like protein [Pseudomonadota bacterium]
MDLNNQKVDSVMSTRLWGKRPRSLGGNAKRGVHGDSVFGDFVVLQCDGIVGIGPSSATKEDAEALMQKPMRELFLSNYRVVPQFRMFEYPLLDWLGKKMNCPVWKFFAREESTPDAGVPAYASSIYFDDLEADSPQRGIQQLCDNAKHDWEAGHRAFKIKVGRGAYQMELLQGLKRDIDVICAIRETVGPDAGLMIDANNGYNINLAKTLLTETAACNLQFFEEPFHEDIQVTPKFRDWIKEEDLGVLLADGEGKRSPDVIPLALKGAIDILQLDIRWHGFNNLLDLEDELEGSNVIQSPHNYPGCYGNYATAQIAPAISRFMYIEWDEVSFPALDVSGYSLKDGRCFVPDMPGMGINMDMDLFGREMMKNGWSIST